MLTDVTLDYKFFAVRCEGELHYSQIGYVDNNDIHHAKVTEFAEMLQRKFGGGNRELPTNTHYHPTIVLGILIVVDNVMILVFVVVVFILIVAVSVVIFAVVVVDVDFPITITIRGIF